VLAGAATGPGLAGEGTGRALCVCADARVATAKITIARGMFFTGFLDLVEIRRD